jgi:hypothetical protein
MSRTRTFAAFWWDFVAGDDWRLTTGLLLALATTLLLNQSNLPAWWLLPATVALLLADSLRRATRIRLGRSRLRAPELPGDSTER